MIESERPAVRIFTLADHAVVAPDGKLYVNGGGVDQFYLRQVPQPVAPLFLVVRVRIPWHMTGEPHTLVVRVLDGDRKPLSADPLVKADFEVGRAPGQRPGDELAMTLAIPILGVTAQQEGTIYFHLELGEELLDILPLKLVQHPAPQLLPPMMG